MGAALLYGDGAITPAISVLSAIEGLEVAAPSLSSVVVPVTVVILLILFMAQRYGTGLIGKLFGPIMLLWFVTIGLLGIAGIWNNAAILAALNPFQALHFLIHAKPIVSFAVIGAAFLAVTGGEAMYADMGHFGRNPIRFAWFAVALPALTLNYFGQGALILSDPTAADNPFYKLVPGWFHFPMIAFATAATVIASQAIISGAFSLARQSMQLGILPRLTIKQTANDEFGQIYVPLVNWMLCAATMIAVVGFESSAALAWCLRHRRLAADGDHHPACSPGGAAMGLQSFPGHPGEWRILHRRSHIRHRQLDQAHRGRLVSAAARRRRGHADANLAAWTGPGRNRASPPSHGRAGLFRPDGRRKTSPAARHRAFLSSASAAMPLSLSVFLRHTHAIPERVLLVTVEGSEVPRIRDEDRVEIVSLRPDFQRIILHYGFMEEPDILRGLRHAVSLGLLKDVDLAKVSFYIGSETMIPGKKYAGMALWREALYAMLQRNAERSAAYFRIPAPQVVQLGVELEI